LVKEALDEARRRHLQVVARCEFVAGYLRRHPEYQDLLAAVS
jgi:predicted GNAT family acetyltransferase